MMFSILTYPPTEEQIRLIEWFGLQGEVWLTMVRVVSLIFILAALCVWTKFLWLKICRSVIVVSVLILALSPAVWVVILSHPLIALGLLMMSLVLSIKSKYLPLVIFVLPLFNLYLIGNQPAVMHKLGLKDAQEEVNNRFYAEDSLKENISSPLWWRRISSNKYFFSYKQLVSEFLPFFDLESLFFGEINPTEQKSIVMFYWTEIFLLIFGLYYLIKQKNKEINHFLLVSGLIVWLSFVFSSGQINLRLVGAMWPISLILAMGLVSMSKYIALPLSLLVGYGVLINVIDLNRRSEYWFDNRPLVYQFWFENINKLDLSKYETIRISSRVGNAKSYCFYYLGEKCRKYNFIFESFEVPKEEIEKNTLLAGFSGEFMGSREDNVFDNWTDKAGAHGVRVLSKSKVRDTIAFRYGEDIGLAEIK